MLAIVALLILSADVSFLSANPEGFRSQDFTHKRRLMVEHQIRRRGVTDRATLTAMETVPRHEFVPARARAAAYRDGPLPIGYGQTISQPYIVAYMTELLRVNAADKVLEVGTGSGYQAAVLGEIVREVRTIEIIPELGKNARQRLERLGYENVHVKIADGYHGWPEHGPYDGIIVTAAAEHIPPPLIRQLKDGGRMVIPVGHPFFVQNLVLVEKKNGKVTTENLLPVAFVPFTRSR
ncbi:protein-L-isoaspartate O-methyltransferase [Desulfonema ishimotonii]|uniref:Protein-L-isoaspartate O-methyltransferase n=2 Tax=Desulfonema ishimotonii TaxID=45657 RepID=A0A401FS55_9BACT|nr:protein-L-isoaspartate O-methyltransferase [Desulfonema ishimotonii]